MADDADRAQERDEIESPTRIAASRRPVGPEATGRCLWCDAEVTPPARWCDVECREDYEKSERMKAQRPR